MGYFSQYNATPKTRVSGQPEIYQETDAQGNTKVTMGASLPGANYNDDVQEVAVVGDIPIAINTAATTVVKTGAGIVNVVRVLGGTLGNVTIYDNTAASGTVLCPTVTPVANQVLIENLRFSTGLTIVTAAATVVTGSAK